MKVEVDQDACIGCGLCIDTAPNVFAWNDESKSYVIVEVVPKDDEPAAKESVESCPTEAIHYKD